MSLERFEELYERYCDRALNDAERAEFVALMADPQMRKHFVELTRLDTQLSDEARIAQLTPASLKKRRAPKKPAAFAMHYVWSAAALVVLALALYLAFRTQPRVVAIVTRLEGAPAIRRGSERLAASAGLQLLSGDVVVTQSADVLACKFSADNTQIDVHESSALTLAISSDAKRLVLDSGALSADVSAQPTGSPILVKTPDSEARILGTKFTVAVEEKQTTLKVDEGHVRLKRLKDSAEVDVKTGSFAVSNDSSTPLAAVTSPVVTGFSLIDVDSGKPIAGFNPIPANIDIAVHELPTRRLIVIANTSGTVGSVKIELEGKSVTLSKPPFVGSAEAVARVLKLDSKSNARYSLKATPYTGSNGTGVAGAPYILNGNIIVKR